ncbi:MAG: transporter substrate-binding domain-containing protein, partial [Pseudomonadota bacterium]
MLIALWLALALPGVGQAQTAAEPLPMGWTDLYPWFFRGPDGAVAGFGLELTKELGKAAGFEPAAVEFGTVPNWVAAQIAGQVILVPAVARLPAMEASSVFSDPLFETTVQLAIRIEDKGRFDPKDLSGRRIGVLPPAAGSDPALLPGATLFEYTNTRAALIGLLGGEIDAISAEATLVFAEARRARLDNRIAFVEEPLMTIARFILLHQSRADLLPAINAEIARMKADGRLEALITRFNIHLPEPEPEVLQIGVFDLPPHMSVRPDGSASGFAVEVLESVAKIAGLRTAVVPIDIQNFAPGDPHDILPIATITEDRQQAMDFAYPIEASTFSIFMRQGETAGVAGLSDLGDRAVGVISTSLAHNQATAAGLSNIVPYGPGKDVADMMADLDAGGIEAALFEATNVHELLADGALSDRIVEITPPFFISQRAPALRPGLGSVRERLNAVIPGYLVSDEYLALREKYFGTGAVWTKERLFWFGGLSAILALGALILVAGTQMRARTRTLAAEARAAQADRQAAYQGRFLEAIFNAATSGIVALNREGLVVRANRAARHILGGISQPTPFPWPAQIKFLEAETLHPLDASADPIRRALSGHTLRGETHLVRRLQKGDPQRYVRIDSAQLHIEDESDLAVLVIDDVSNEERNRQVVERKSRLDALGQLTGGIAHDFNNLLAAQLYAVDLARRASDPDKRENFLEIASGSIQRGRALTSRLLAFARKQPGLAAVRSVADVCEDFRKLVRPMLEAQFDITFTLDDPRL